MNCHQIKIKMSVEMSADELVDLLLAPSVQVLKLVEITNNVQPGIKFSMKILRNLTSFKFHYISIEIGVNSINAHKIFF